VTVYLIETIKTVIASILTASVLCTAPSGVISQEDAIEISRQYIMAVLEIDTANDEITMKLFEGNIPIWVGKVEHQHIISFTINASTGQWLVLQTQLPQDHNLPRQNITMEEYVAMSGATPQNIDSYLHLATEYAQRHFNQTELTSIEFVGKRPNRIPQTMATNNRINFFENLLRFDAVDSNGRKAMIEISYETQQLRMVTSFHYYFNSMIYLV